MSTTPNRLASAYSPYLRQHANNPVDWHPWGPKAFAAARRSDRPVFLSIGYSTCHWCHVMAHESFENPDIAALLNDGFVCIKVDREERPDIDHIYMEACQLMTGSGGWPLSIFMTPDRQPFYAATYIPPAATAGRPGMIELLPRITAMWRNQRDHLLQAAQQILAALRQTPVKKNGGQLDDSLLHQACAALDRTFDPSNGGFGMAPKFPSPHCLQFLLHYGVQHDRPEATEMAVRSLHALRRGGIHDHIGGGFHRYATDARWRVPHFEKMLSDQALLAIAFSEGFLATGDNRLLGVTRDTLTYVLRDMRTKQGTFHAAEDADSAGREGAFYVWTLTELQQLLGTEAALFADAFNCTAAGNYHEEATGRPTGANVLYQSTDTHTLARRHRTTVEGVRSRIEHCRRLLRKQRNRRERPACDTKVMTDWNGLMIAALALCGRAAQDRTFIDAGARTARTILASHVTPDGDCAHCLRGSAPPIAGQLPDYAYLCWGLIELYAATYDSAWLQAAASLTDRAESLFAAHDHGLYYTSDATTDLIVRPTQIYDHALPSGNAVMACNLLRLSRLCNREHYARRATDMVHACLDSLRAVPQAHTHMLQAVGWLLGPRREIVIAGDPAAADTRALLQITSCRLLPATVVLLRSTTEPEPSLGHLAGYHDLQGTAAAYVCVANTCAAPVSDPTQLSALLDSDTHPRPS